MQSRQQAGVTLIELLTVIVVLGILSAIAVPSYRSYLMRTNRTDAKSALLQVQAAEEKYFLQYNKYTTDVTGAPPAGLGMPGTTANGYYTLSVADRKDASNNVVGYVATATPTSSGGQNKDSKCGNFTLDDTGKRGVGTSGNVAACWK
jgi:type IV pilus assembly protein PilE